MSYLQKRVTKSPVMRFFLSSGKRGHGDALFLLE
jgi:hypothetical protein